MSDWRETKESQEQDVPRETDEEKLGTQGISSMQGNVDVGGNDAPQVADKSDDSDDLATVRSQKSPEIPTSPEVEGQTIKITEEQGEDTEGKIKPPPGYSGGPERGW